MSGEALLDAMNDVRDEYIFQMMTRMSGAADKTPRRRVLRTVLLAAALACLLAATAFAVYRGSMAYRRPQPGDEPRYYITNAGVDGSETLHLNFGTSSMILHFETTAEGFRHAFRPGEYPETALGLHGAGQNIVPWTGEIFEIPIEELIANPKAERPEPVPDYEKLEQMGMTLEEAESWFCTASFYDDDGSLALRIDLADVDALHRHDLIVGWLGGEAEVVKEDVWNGYQRVEIHLAPLEGKTDQEINHLLLFQPEEQFLLTILGDATKLDFADLEAAAEGIRVHRTELALRAEENPEFNFSVLGLGNG